MLVVQRLGALEQLDRPFDALRVAAVADQQVTQRALCGGGCLAGRVVEAAGSRDDLLGEVGASGRLALSDAVELGG